MVALYAELDGRAEQLRQASELKTRFLSNMSHEFRTPLNSVLALSRLLLDRIDGELTAEQERQVGYIRRSAESLLELVNDMLDLAKVEAGKAEIRPVRFAVTSLFGALRGALKPLLTSASVELVFEPPQDLPPLYTDEAKVAQILRNLISNALKFTEQGEVRVTARLERRRSERHLRRARHRHRHRAGGSRAHLRGILAGRHQAAEEGQGHRPRPAVVALAGATSGRRPHRRKRSGTGLGVLADHSGRARRAGPRNPSPRQGSKSVLLIDDDETFRYVLRQIVGNESRYEFMEADGGEQGLKIAREKKPDVIILDLQMPAVDGFTVLQQLAADERTSAIPVVVSTSMTIDATLRSRLPEHVRLISKNAISRESVSSVPARRRSGCP